MSAGHHPRLPISTRHAFALAFDLAVRRDALHSLVVPLLLRAPWILALALLPLPSETDRPGRAMLLRSAAMLGDFLALLLVTAMMRFRARSVFNTPSERGPASAFECYALGLRRLPWLFVTEVVRNLALIFGTFLFVVPAVFLGYRLTFATEAAVLTDRDTASAFAHSYRITPGRFERWLEMVVMSVLLGLVMVFIATLVTIALPGANVPALVALSLLLVAVVTPVIQYAWTFFYLRLVESEAAAVEVGPLVARRDRRESEPPRPWDEAPTAAEPRLRLVEPYRVRETEEQPPV